MFKTLQRSCVMNTVAQVIAKDKEVMKSFHEGLLQCASWVMIKQYLSQGRIVSKVNWLNAIHSKYTFLLLVWVDQRLLLCSASSVHTGCTMLWLHSCVWPCLY